MQCNIVLNANYGLLIWLRRRRCEAYLFEFRQCEAVADNCFNLIFNHNNNRFVNGRDVLCNWRGSWIVGGRVVAFLCRKRMRYFLVMGSAFHARVAIIAG